MVYLILAVPLAAFGIWRIRAGLYLLDLTDTPVDKPVQTRLQRAMRGPPEMRGLAALVGGCLSLIGAIAAVVAAFR